MMGDLKERISSIENRVEKLLKEKEEDRKTILNLIDKCTKVIGQTNERVDKHFEDLGLVSDRLNLAEGMVEIFKKDISELRSKIYKEDTDETS